MDLGNISCYKMRELVLYCGGVAGSNMMMPPLTCRSEIC